MKLPNPSGGRGMTTVKKMVISAMLIVAGVILPQAFHSVPMAGIVILPMHIPILLAGLICGPFYGLYVGISSPLLSHLFFGMPPTPILPAMLCELPVYGFVAGGIMWFLVRKSFAHLYAKTYGSLIGAMLIGRVVFGAVNALIFNVGEYTLHMWLTAAFVTALPGIVIQVMAIPSIVIALQKEKLIELKGRTESQERT
jgi:niacin transporter